MRSQESTARSNYDALTLSLKRRYATKLQFYTNYTLSYNRDDDSNERNFAGITYENAFNLADEYRWARNDIRHRWVFSGMYDLPLGFQIGTIGEWRTGGPFSAFTNTDSNGDGQFTDKPIIGGIPLLRNAFRQPNIFNQNVRVSRNFKIREGHQVALIFEMFNIWNTENLHSVQARTKAPPPPWAPVGVSDKRHFRRSAPSVFPTVRSIERESMWASLSSCRSLQSTRSNARPCTSRKKAS